MARIDDFRSHLVGGGARPSQFMVSLTFPNALGLTTGDAANYGEFLVKTASLPASTVSPIEVPYRGRNIKIAGERQFANWQVTVINDNDFKIRNVMEQWSQRILEHTTTSGRQAPVDYATDMGVSQLDRDGNVLRMYKFHNVWPQNVSEIQLDFGATNQLEEFNIEFSVDYWTAQGSGIDIA